MVLRLQARDSILVGKLNQVLGSNRPIRHVPRQQPTQQDQVCLVVSNLRLSDALIKQGMYQAKSLTLTFPTSDQVPKNLLRHFVRGYYDGDGGLCLSRGRATHPSLSICASLPFALALIDIVKAQGCHMTLHKPSAIHSLTMTGRVQCVRFCDWMYQDVNGLFLPRKYAKYLECKNYVRPKRKGRSSIYRGISIHRGATGLRYVVRITHPQCKQYVGTYRDEQEAVQAYNETIIRSGLNVPLNVFNQP